MPSRLVGELVMEELHGLDEVAYVRFASVYRRFQDITEFEEEIKRLQRISETAAQPRTDVAVAGPAREEEEKTGAYTIDMKAAGFIT